MRLASSAVASRSADEFGQFVEQRHVGLRPRPWLVAHDRRAFVLGEVEQAGLLVELGKKAPGLELGPQRVEHAAERGCGRQLGPQVLFVTRVQDFAAAKLPRPLTSQDSHYRVDEYPPGRIVRQRLPGIGIDASLGF